VTAAAHTVAHQSNLSGWVVIAGIVVVVAYLIRRKLRG
jgi:hypothetical protein